MGRCGYGLILTAALAAAGCAAAAAPDDVSQHQVGDNVDLAGTTGVVVDNCVDGGSCTTTNPGDCAMGHAVCSGDVQSCVPDVTTQRCYDGPTATANVGACVPGTQTCIGTVGTCSGEVLPAAQENCFNDIDDDCDGTLNNGCPDHFVTGTAHPLTAHGNSTGGSAFSLRCPANTFVSKTIIYGDNPDQYLSGLDIFCGTPTLVRGASSYTVTVAVSATPLSIRGVTTAADTSTFDCGAGFVPGWWTTGEYDAGGLDDFGGFCAATALTLSPTNQLTLTMTKQGNGQADGYTVNGATSFEDDCAQGEVLIGYDGRHGNFLDYFQAVCAPLQTVYK